MSKESPIELDKLKLDKDGHNEFTQEVMDSPAPISRDSFEIDLESAEPEPPKFQITREFALTLFVLWFGNFLTSLDGTIVSTTMSNIAADFNQSNMVTWIATSYLLTSTAFQPLYGKTSDILGRKELLLCAQALFTLGIFLSSFAVNVQTLSLARAVAGMGGAGIFALSNIVISDVVPLAHRSLFMGYGSIVGSTSQMLGGPVGGWCIVTIGWRMMFLIQVPFLLLCMDILWYKVDIKVEHIPDAAQRYSKENLKRIDIGGIITLNLAVSSIIFLVSSTEHTTKLYKTFFSILLVSSSIAYLYVENYIAVEKIIDPEILKGEIGVLGFVNGVSSLSLYMVLFIIPVYLQVVQGVSVTNIGYYTMFFVVSTAFGSLAAGYEIRKHDKSEAMTMVAGVTSSFNFFIIQMTGFLVLLGIVASVSPESSSFVWRFLMIVSLVISGYGAGGYGVGIGIFVIGKAGRRGQASANTVVSLIKQLGNVLGVSISLATYQSTISFKLHEYFHMKDNLQYIEDLINDTNYIRDGLSREFVAPVLEIYKGGICKAFYTPLFVSLFALVVMYFVCRKVKKDVWA